MVFQTRIEQMYRDVRLFLLHIPFGETEIGMIEFSTVATRLVHITPVDTVANRDSLLNKIPRNATSSTCIGCGIREAIEVS